MELHEYMESRGIARESIAAEQEKTRERIEAYKLAQIRKLKDLTQASVAQSMGVSQKRISELERGELGSMRLDTLSRYAESLGGKLVASIEFPRSYRYACSLKICNNSLTFTDYYGRSPNQHALWANRLNVSCENAPQ